MEILIGVVCFFLGMLFTNSLIRAKIDDFFDKLKEEGIISHEFLTFKYAKVNNEETVTIIRTTNEK